MLTLSLPSKTFLAGEYVAPLGGPAILMSTSPHFLMEVGREKRAIPPYSPAGKFLKRYAKDFKSQQLNFKDPHQGQGGLGASSAQFAFCYFLKHQKPIQNIERKELLREYLEMAWNGEGVPPSGADVIAQLMGQKITYYDKSTNHLEYIDWPFPEWAFCLVRTGNKIITHKHLNKLKLRLPGETFMYVKNIWESMKNKDNQRFLYEIQKFTRTLQEHKLLWEKSFSLIKKIKNWPSVHMVKGCGAMGADVLCIVHDADKEKTIHKYLKEENLVPFAGLKDLSSGLIVEKK